MNIDPLVPSDKFSDPIWVERYGQINSNKLPNSRLVFLGDSITQGWEYEGSEHWGIFRSRYNAVNCGINGDKIQNLLWRILNGQVSDLNPEMVFILIGANNLKNNVEDDIVQGIELVYKTVTELWPSAMVRVLSLFPRGHSGSDQYRIKAGAVNTILASKIDTIKIWDEFLDNKRLRKKVMYDYLHLTSDGYRTLFETLRPIVEVCLGR